MNILMMRLCIATLLVISVFAHGYRKCGGGIPGIELQKIDTGSLLYTINNEQDNNSINNRVLQDTNQIRITYDENYLNLAENKKYKYVIKNALDTAINFFTKLIKVVNPVTQEFKISTCGDYPISAKQKTISIKSDMHLYVQMKSDSSNWLARAGACFSQLSDNRPIAGIVQFNTNYLSTDMNNFKFQDLVEMTIHELFHVLVFSPDYFKIYPKKYTTSNYSTGSTPWIAFPNVLQWAKDHFSCTTIDKVYLEDDGGSGSKGAHWERSLFFNDIMTASEMAGDQIWSGINNALLKDSGWYVVLDETQQDTLFWGKKKNCDFYQSTCSLLPLPEEFCNSSSTIMTGFYNIGYGQCTNSDPLLDNSCKYVQPYSNTVCYNFENSSNSENASFILAGSKFGWDSKSFVSSLRPNGSALPGGKNDLAQCYQSKCIPVGPNWKIEVTIGSSNIKTECSSNNETKTVPGYDGTLSCPNISNFCERSYNCENFCNSGGYCINKTCYCTPGFSGPNCKCGNGTFWKTNQCQKCSLQNCWKCDGNDKCVACADGFTLDVTTIKCVAIEFDDTFSHSKILQISFILLILSFNLVI